MQINKISNTAFKGHIISKPNKTLFKESLKQTGYFSKGQVNAIADSTDSFCKSIEEYTSDDVLFEVFVNPVKYRSEYAGRQKGIQLQVKASDPEYEITWSCKDGAIATSREDESGQKILKSPKEIKKEFKKRGDAIITEFNKFDQEGVYKLSKCSGMGHTVVRT